MSDPKDFDLQTRLIHAGEPRHLGAVSIPVYQSSTFVSDGTSSYHDIRYGRLSNTPNHVALHEKLAAIENAEGALVTSSGMAAITTSLLALLREGDHLLAQNVLYGGTFDFVVKDLPRFGIAFDLVDGSNPDEWKAKIRPNTRAFYVETISNPLMTVPQLREAVAFAREHDLVSMIDNTFASPVNFRPAELGFDLSLHSATKYLNGHTDLIAGAVIGRAECVHTVKMTLDHLGGSLDPHACFLLHRGMKTLALRVGFQNGSALALARFLESHPAVTRVHYPGLESNASHAVAKELLEGFGGMLSVELDGDVARADQFMHSLRLAIEAPSLGGMETLVSRPAMMSHAGLTPEERSRTGISENLIRISVGIEATGDLVEDFRQALG